MRDPLQAFREAILAALGYAPEVIEPGKLHRFATSERRGDDAGWCKLFDDLRGGIKRAIVAAACRGFPATWAHWLIKRGGLRDA